jgi:hypothetical protein
MPLCTNPPRPDCHTTVLDPAGKPRTMLKGLTTATGDQAFELCLRASCLSAAEEHLADVVGRRLDRTAAYVG